MNLKNYMQNKHKYYKFSMTRTIYKSSKQNTFEDMFLQFII